MYPNHYIGVSICLFMERELLGLTETVVVKGIKSHFEVLARVDTGATRCSIDLGLAEKLGYTVKSSRIVKSANGTGKRETALFNIILRGVNYSIECTLADRTNMTYKMLIGQNLMKVAKVMVDPLQ